MIDRQSKLSVSQQAKILHIPRTSLYYQRKGWSQEDLSLMARLDELHLAYPFMGARQLKRTLAQCDGTLVGRRHLSRLMRHMGLRALCPQPGTSRPAPQNKTYSYLLRGLSIERSNQVWALDTTYIPMPQGFVYLTAVLDIASRKVLSHKVATTMEASHAVELVQHAINRYGAPEIINTDQGSQFTAQAFVDVVHGCGAQLSMDGRGAWRDNVFVERLWRSIKYEDVYLHCYDTPAKARQGIAQYIDWYNQTRGHSSLNGNTPNRAYEQWLRPLQEAA